MTSSLPDTIRSVDELDEHLSEPTDRVREILARLDGDILIAGAGGKMGPTLARMAQRASGPDRHVFAVSRFSNPDLEQRLQSWGIRTIRGDLLDRQFVDQLPAAANVVTMTGMKFGATGAEALTWASNILAASHLCERYKTSRIAAFSTGNVYGHSSPDSPGSMETDAPAPVGEYAMSCLGRERIYAYYSDRNATPVSIIRLNYANELRYGVLVDLARQIHTGQAVDLTMGHVNLIWQGDANALALCALGDASVPANILNVAGDQPLAVREICTELAHRLRTKASFIGAEAGDALLSCNAKMSALHGHPRTPITRMLDWVADWVRSDGASLNKPTHFQTRDGRF